MKKRKFAEGGVPKGGRFDEDTYTRAHRFVESGGDKEDSKPAAKKARKVETAPTAGEAKDKASQSAADRMDSSSESRGSRFPDQKEGGKAAAEADYKRITKPGRDAIEGFYPETMIGGAGAAARGAMTAMAAKRAADASRAASSMAATRAATNTPGAARLAEAAKRSKDASDARLPSEVMDILNRPMKKGGSVAKYAKGGSIDGIAQRGKTRGKVC